MQAAKSAEVVMVFPSGGDNRATDFNYALGSAYIIAYLEKKGVDAFQFVYNLPITIRECAEKILKYHPKIVGFTVFNSNYLQCVLIAGCIKNIDSEVITVFGGPVPTVMSKNIMEDNACIDICVAGYGEEVFLNLIRKLSRQNYNFSITNLSNVDSLTYRNEKRIRTNPGVNLGLLNKRSPKGLDNYPSPYLAGIIPLHEAANIGIITARGCNQNCTFCNCSVLSQKKMYFHSIERVIDELAYIARYTDHKAPITIHDDAFTLVPGRARKICEKIIENNINIHLKCITRCDLITEDLLDLMKKAGFVSVGFSLESAVPKVLRAIGKVHPAEDLPSDNLEKEKKFIRNLIRITSYAKKIGMDPVSVSVMVGLPGETLAEAQRTIDMVRRLNIDHYVHNIFSIYPGTPIHECYRRYGYRIKHKGGHRLFTETVHPNDVRNSVKMAPNAKQALQAPSYDNANLKILALTTRRRKQKEFFENIILLSDHIRPGLVEWLQDSLAINGHITQIFSGKDAFVKNAEKSYFNLHKFYSPSLYYDRYFWRNDQKRHRTLISGRTVFAFEKNSGFPIHFMQTQTALDVYQDENANLRTVISADCLIDDSLKLHEFLMHLANKDDVNTYLAENKAFPYFSSLCRWTRGLANCQNCETALITEDDCVYVCYNGEAIGRVGMPVNEMLHNLEQKQNKTKEIRNCRKCLRRATCVKCIFPFPLTADRYCQLKKSHDTTDFAEQLKIFDTFKDILHPLPLNACDRVTEDGG
jgi:radical SAM superfamily enzyme YgiQ (UPF0313 family)